MACETASREHSRVVNKNSYICSQHFEDNCFIKSIGWQRIHLKPDSVPTKFIYTVEKPKRKKPVDWVLLNTKKTQKKKSKQHSVSEPINIENTDLKSGSDGIETEHLEGEGLVQTGIKKTRKFAGWLLWRSSHHYRLPCRRPGFDHSWGHFS